MQETNQLNKQAYVLDDHQLFADSFTLLLERYMHFDQVQSFSKAADLLSVMAEIGPKEVYVFLDYYLEDDNGLQVFTEIKRLNKKALIIFTTSAISTGVIQNLIAAKPHGVLSKSSDVQTMIHVTEQASKGDIAIDDNLLAILKSVENLPQFTPRELQLLKEFAKGSSIAHVAETMFLSKHTVVAHRRKMMGKAKCHSIGQLIRFANDNDLI